MLLYVLLGWAGLRAREGDVAAAGALLGAVQAELDRIGEVLDPAEQLELSSHVEMAQATDPAAYEQAFERGLQLSLDEARGLVGAG